MINKVPRYYTNLAPDNSAATWALLSAVEQKEIRDVISSSLQRGGN
jgi:hypothetical protein